MRLCGFVHAVRGLGAILVSTTILVAESPNSPNPSSYAPSVDLERQVFNLIKTIEASLADRATYRGPTQVLTARRAHTLAAVATVIANHDEQCSLRSRAERLANASLILANTASDHSAASKAFSEIKSSLSASGGGTRIPWERSADVEQLMKYLPAIYSRLEKSTTGSRFERMIERNKGDAATLAAIAQVSMYDGRYCDKPAKETLWIKMCSQFRDALADVNTALRQRKRDAAGEALSRAKRSCHSCHNSFRD